MDSARRELLDQHKTLILPENIDYAAYELIAEAATFYPSEPIRMFCAGAGGDCDYTLAMAGIIQAHSNFIGLLAGDAVSSHAVLFASCKRRYVYPWARIGIHQTNYGGLTAPLTANVLGQRLADLERSDTAYAEILASACTSTYKHDWWLESIREAPVVGFTYFGTHWLVMQGMAKPVAELERERG